MDTMTQDEAIRLALDYDRVTARALSRREQVDLLAENRAALMRYHNPDTPQGVHCTRTAIEIILRTSDRFWNLYDPDFLATLPYERQAFLAALGCNERQTEHRYGSVIRSPDILPADSRALFFAATGMGKLRYNDDWAFFAPLLVRMQFKAEILNAKPPQPPTSVSYYAFFHGFPRSFGDRLPDGLKAAISADSPAQFAIARTLCGRRLSKFLFLHLLDQKAKEILASNMKALAGQLPLDSLAIYCASTAPAALAIRLIPAIEDHAPGTIAAAKDVFGNNALWYSLYRKTQGADQDASQDLGTLLKHLGCDPDAPNCLALTYNSVRKAQQALDAARDAYFG